MQTFIRSIAAALIAAVIAMLGASVAVAGISDVDPSLPVIAGGQIIDSSQGSPNPMSVCGTSDYGENSLASDNFLPLNRWGSELGSFHSRTDWKSIANIQAMQRAWGAGSIFSLGDTGWSITQGLTAMSVRFCPLESLGYEMDKAAARAGSVLFSSTTSRAVSTALVSVLVVAMILTAVFQSLRGQGRPWGQLIAKLLILGLFAIMMAGATATTEEKYGKMSPGWLLSNMNTTMNLVATLPATIMEESRDAEKGNSNDLTSCDMYVSELRDQYRVMNGRYTGSSLPRVLSSLWEDTGLVAWKHAQFGFNDYADNAYCRLLDSNAGVVVERAGWRNAGSANIMDGYWKGTRIPSPVDHTDSLAMTLGTTEADTDVALVGWAACRVNSAGEWTWAQGAVQDGLVNNPDAKASEECHKWWTTLSADYETGANEGIVDAGIDALGSLVGLGKTQSVFNHNPVYADTIATTSGDAQDFVINLHASRGGGPMSIAMGYLISSAIILVVFGALSGLVVVAKITSLLMIFAMFIVLLVAMLPKQNQGELLGNYLQKMLGVLLLTSGSVLLFSMVAMMTRIMMTLGQSMQSGPMGLMIWLGISPLAAVFGMSWIFKKILKAPNPMSLKGMAAWAGAGAVVGGTIGGAVGDRMGGRASRAGERMGENLANRAVDSVTGGRLGGANYRLSPHDDSGRRKGKDKGEQRAQDAGLNPGAEGNAQQSAEATKAAVEHVAKAAAPDSKPEDAGSLFERKARATASEQVKKDAAARRGTKPWGSAYNEQIADGKGRTRAALTAFARAPGSASWAATKTVAKKGLKYGAIGGVVAATAGLGIIPAAAIGGGLIAKRALSRRAQVNSRLGDARQSLISEALDELNQGPENAPSEKPTPPEKVSPSGQPRPRKIIIASAEGEAIQSSPPGNPSPVPPAKNQPAPSRPDPNDGFEKTWDVGD